MTQQEVLQNIQWRESELEQGKSIGTFKELFGQFSALLLRKSKTGASHATVLMTDPANPKKTFNVVCSLAMTPLVREGKIGLEEIAGFPVFHGDKGFFVGIPSQGWVPVNKITAKEFKPEAVSHDDIISLD